VSDTEYRDWITWFENFPLNGTIARIMGNGVSVYKVKTKRAELMGGGV